MSNEFLSATLQAQGYTGATAGTPYKPTTEAQQQTLQDLYNRSFNSQVQSPPSSQAVHLNVNFDGTQNSEFTVPGESRTNVWQLQDLQKKATTDGLDNTIYERGIGAQTLPTGTLYANGNPDPGSSTSNWESTPWKAGEIGQEILLRAYDRLEKRVQAILAENPNAEIALNLSGFSRGSAEAVAFANLLNERGIEGLYKPGEVPINSMVLYDPVSQTAGALNTTWPTNVKNALVMVAMNEGRAIMPAMPVGANAIIVGVPGAHANIGGSFNEQGIQAVTLKLAHEFLQANGVPMADIPANLQPDWSQMVVHNSALDSYGNVKWSYTDGNRYYESGGLGSISVQDYLGQKFKLDPIYVKVDGKYEFTGFSKTISTDTTDPETGIRSTSKDITLLDKGARVLSRSFESNSNDSTGQTIASLSVSYAPDGVNILKTTLTERQPDNSVLQTVRNGQGNTLSQTHTQSFDDGSRLSETRNALGQLISTSNTTLHEQANGQSVQVTETVNHLAKGTEIASSKELLTSGGAKIVNSTTADGHIQEDTWATVDGKQTLQSSKIISYSQAERDTAALDVSLAGLELMQALRSGNKVQAAGSLIRLVNNAEIASNQMPTLGAIGTGFSGAVSLISALDSWGNASDGERIALTARAVLGANEVAKAFSANGQTGFLDASGAALGALQGVVALSNLEDTIKSKNPFAIASSVMALTNAAVATGLVSSATAAGALGTSAFSSAAVFGPQAMIAVAIASIVFGSLFGGSIEYPSPPPAGSIEIGRLADGTLGMLIKDADGHINEQRSLTGRVLVRSYAQDSYTDENGNSYGQDRTVYANQDWGLGANVLSQRMVSLIGELQTQANKDGTHLVLDRLPTLSVHGYPSFERNGVDNFFFGLRFNDPGTGAQQLMAAANQDMAKQFKEIAGYAGAVVGNTEWAQIQAKQAAGDSYATETEGQYVDRLSGTKEGDSLLTKAQADAQEASNRQSYSLLTLDLEGNGITRRAQQAAGMSLEDVQADTTKGITRLDVDNDGFMELTEWVGSKEAILGLDRNGDGQLSTADELFSGGELSDAAEGLGIKRLAFFDANKDGKLDKLDAYFNSFKLWLDINGDARTGVGELYGLADAGIKSINVSTGVVSFTDGQAITLQRTQLSADVRGVAVNQSAWLCAA